MTLKIRKSNERGHSQLDWLDSKHTFSFADYHDERYMGFGSLRVINEDVINAREGFGRHPHKNMEIITYVIHGALEHRDSLGTGSIIRPGEIQRMSAGTGIEHSEYNHSKDAPLHLLQIWIKPSTMGLQPGYEQKQIQKIDNQLILIGAQEPHENSVLIHQDVQLYVAYLTPGAVIHYALEKDRIGWLQLIRGQIQIDNQILTAGDGVGIQDMPHLDIHCMEAAELLWFDLHQ